MFLTLLYILQLGLSCYGFSLCYQLYKININNPFILQLLKLIIIYYIIDYPCNCRSCIITVREIVNNKSAKMLSNKIIHKMLSLTVDTKLLVS